MEDKVTEIVVGSAVVVILKQRRGEIFKMIKLICCNCYSALSIVNLGRSDEKEKDTWSLVCQECNLSPAISSTDFNQIIEKWLDIETQKEYEEMFPAIKNIRREKKLKGKDFIKSILKQSEGPITFEGEFKKKCLQ